MESFKNTHNYTRAVVCALLTVLLVGGSGVVAVDVITAGDWKGPLVVVAIFSGFMFLFGLVLLIGCFAFFSWLYLLREKQFRGAASGDDRFVQRVAIQPDKQHALGFGETLTLARRRSGSSTASNCFVALFFSLLFAGSGEALLFFALPSLGHSALNPFYSSVFVYEPAPASSLSWLDWFSAAFPLVINFFLAFGLLAVVVQGQRQVIIADDRGITSKTSLSRRQYIPWDDIRLFNRSVEKKPGMVEGQYIVWGQEHGLAFEVFGPQTTLPARNQSRPSNDTYLYDGGYDLYRENAGRLLATIVARSYVSLSASLTPSFVKRIKRRYPRHLSLEDIANAPLAGKALQPTVSEEGQASGPSELTLAIRMALPGLVAESLVWFAVLAALVFVFADLAGLFSEFSDINVLPWFWGLMVVLGYPAAYSLAFQRRRNKMPKVIAGPQGLTRKTESPNTTITIPWNELEAWAVKPLSETTNSDNMYIACSVNQTLTWVEPADAKLAGRKVQGDRQIAYRERAEQLHRLIVARTGKPLRELSAQPRSPQELGAV